MMTTATQSPSARRHQLNQAVDVAWRRVDALLGQAARGGSRVPPGLAHAIEVASEYYDLCCETLEQFDARRKGGRS